MAPMFHQKIIPNTSFAAAINTVVDEYNCGRPCGRLLDQLSQTVPSGMFFVNSDKHIRFWNRSAERLTGLNAEDIVGKKCTEALGCQSLEGYCPLDLPYIQETVVDQACTFNIAEKTTKVLKNISVIEDGCGRIAGAIEYFVDVNRQSIAESALEAAAQLIRSMRQAKDEFISNISHEIRTPINGIIGMLDLLSVNEGSDKQNENLRIARGAADSLLQIVDQLLDFSVIEKGNCTFNNEDFNLDAIRKSLYDSFAGQLKLKSIDLKIGIDEQVPRRLSGDSNRLLQVLKNLITNAVKATDKGTIELSIDRSPKTDLFKVSPTKKIYLRFTVQDCGCGIPEEKIAHVFREFSQADGSHTRTKGGLGLGLHTTWRMIKLQGGDLSISSKIGKGTLVEFELPFTIIEEPETAEKAEADPDLNHSYWMEQLEALRFGIDCNDPQLEKRLGRLQRLSLNQGEKVLADYFFRIQLAVRKKDQAGCKRLIEKTRLSITDSTASMIMN